ncbi:MAG: 5'-methylthioadenosine/S-adenosylhomocysteine nucleosidase [Brevinema sp.]
MKIHMFFLVLLFILSGCFLPKIIQSTSTIGIMSAMKEEIDLILTERLDIEHISHASLNYYKGKIGKHRVVVVGGIGLINAAMTATILSEKFHVKTILYSGVGLAVIKDLSIGDIVIGTNFINYMVDHTEFDLPFGHLSRENVGYYVADRKLIDLALNLTNI